MKNVLATLALLAASSAAAADMPSRHVGALSPEADALANEMAYYRGVVVACRASDGTALNEAFWAPRFAVVPQNQRALFAATVKSRAMPTLQQMSGPDAPLKCDDALDLVEDQFPSIAEAGPAAEPICWSDVTDTNRCGAAGDDDILAGVDPLLEGF